MKEHFLTLRLFLILALHWAAQNASAQVISVRDSLMDIEADTMPEPFRMLPELFVTPDGSNPVDYILDNVAGKAKRSITNGNLDKGKVSKRSKKLLERIEKVASGEQRDAPMIRYSFAVVYH